MVERKMKHPTTGEMHDVEMVEIEEIIEKPMKIKLADGTILRIRVDVVEVAKFKGERALDGPSNLQCEKWHYYISAGV